MQDLTPDGLQLVEDVARRNGVSTDAAVTLLRALAAGNGTQAQFNHPELGGMGQWSRGGMIMIGDMFNSGLKYRVDTLATDLAALLGAQPMFAAPVASAQSAASLFVPGASSNWWPASLGVPAATGAQNDMRYAWFPATRRLALQVNGAVRVYDTGDHAISGFSQQQSGDQSLTFNSQLGLVRVADLPEVEPAGADKPAEIPPNPQAADIGDSPSVAAEASPPVASDIFGLIERLAELHQKGILTGEEFAAKKAELLSRI